jgi:universal stress protein A
MEYQRILLAVDFGDQAEVLCQHACDLAKRYSARLKIIHVVEPIVPAPPYELPGVMPLELEQQILEQARRQLEKLAEKYQINETDVIVETGSTKAMIINSAAEHNIDLIIVGSHGRHGVGLLLGSTANAVLHHAPCDVLAVRIGGG